MPNATKICALKIGQIEKNPILALGTSAKDIEKRARVAKAYGNVAPAVVGHSEGSYRILAGQAGLEACARNGAKEMPAVVAEISGEAEQMKLALLLSTVREEGCPLSEGAFIDELVSRHGVTRRELMGLLRKSKSWVSKRQSLASRLSFDVRGMVRDGTVCARTAEEIAKLPQDRQAAFAGEVVRDGLSKADAGRLVGLFLREEPGSAMRQAIMDTPLAVLDACAGERVARRKEKRGMAERIAGSAALLARIAYELKGLLAVADREAMRMAAADLARLQEAVADLRASMDLALRRVSPGEQEGGVAT